VKLSDDYYRLLMPFLPITQRRLEDQQRHEQLDDRGRQLDLLFWSLTEKNRMGLPDPGVKNFLDNSMWYNNEFACATATTQQEDSRPGGYQPIKMNGMVTYNMGGIFSPPDAKGNPRPLLCGQVWTLDPDESVTARKQRNESRDTRHRLRVYLICSYHLPHFFY
jgi:hypothetical protein